MFHVLEKMVNGPSITGPQHYSQSLEIGQRKLISVASAFFQPSRTIHLQKKLRPFFEQDQNQYMLGLDLSWWMTKSH